ncbi:MAG TPA: cytochrome c maturation protein CcmE [Cytophagaceae bacterium]|jgi:cytochrome c-type biogenesis protein CcmE|nr:cytochrome c maturation protein CcmE [Cytophagaceae bacterium]
MKTTHIILLLVIAVAIGVIISTSGDASRYVTFKEAEELAQDSPDEKVHVVGKLKKNNLGEIEGMNYNPAVNPNYFEFVITDNTNREEHVVYFSPKPQDFEKSEQIVIIGGFKGKTFKADKILMKCPSKYEDKKMTTSLEPSLLKL